jgi:hypothetical protein
MFREFGKETKAIIGNITKQMKNDLTIVSYYISICANTNAL